MTARRITVYCVLTACCFSAGGVSQHEVSVVESRESSVASPDAILENSNSFRNAASLEKGEVLSSGSLIWASGAGGEESDSARAIASLQDGSALVTGSFSGTATFGPGEENETVLTALTSQQGTNAFIAKYSPDGTLDWAKSAGGPGGSG